MSSQHHEVHNQTDSWFSLRPCRDKTQGAGMGTSSHKIHRTIEIEEKSSFVFASTGTQRYTKRKHHGGRYTRVRQLPHLSLLHGKDWFGSNAFEPHRNPQQRRPFIFSFYIGNGNGNDNDSDHNGRDASHVPPSSSEQPTTTTALIQPSTT